MAAARTSTAAARKTSSLRVPVGTVISDAESGRADRRSCGRWPGCAGCQGRPGWPRQHPLQVEHQPRAPPVNAWREGPAAHAPTGAQGAGRRRPARPAERRQVHADPSDLRGAPQGRRLSVHDAGAEPGCGSRRREQEFRRCGYPRPDRRRGRRRGTRASLPAPPATNPPAAAYRRHRALRRRRRPGRGRPRHRQGTPALRPCARGEAALAGAEQARPRRRGRAQGARRGIRQVVSLEGPGVRRHRDQRRRLPRSRLCHLRLAAEATGGAGRTGARRERSRARIGRCRRAPAGDQGRVEPRHRQRPRHRPRRGRSLGGGNRRAAPGGKGNRARVVGRDCRRHAATRMERAARGDA